MVRQNILALSLTCIVAISGIIFLDTFAVQIHETLMDSILSLAVLCPRGLWLVPGAFSKCITEINRNHGGIPWNPPKTKQTPQTSRIFGATKIKTQYSLTIS